MAQWHKQYYNDQDATMASENISRKQSHIDMIAISSAEVIFYTNFLHQISVDHTMKMEQEKEVKVIMLMNEDCM